MKPYYKTTELSPQLLMEFTEVAVTQEQIVLEVFRAHRSAMSWSEVSGFLPDMNESSLKRSLTNLMDRGILKKTDDVVLSKYGKPCHRYEIINKAQ
jgi:predicted transcriptional regulator